MGIIGITVLLQVLKSSKIINTFSHVGLKKNSCLILLLLYNIGHYHRVSWEVRIDCQINLEALACLYSYWFCEV